jgi:hypothetical protein
MNRGLKADGGVLPAVLVLSAIMLLIIFGIISLRGNLSMFIYRNHYYKIQKSYIESGFVLYDNNTELVSGTGGEVQYRLFEDKEESEIYINRRLWGLYEVVTISNYNRGISESRMTGAEPADEDYCFYYRENGSPLFIAGNTTIEGTVKFPPSGYKYTQLQSRFFSGKEVERSKIGRSGKTLPERNPEIIRFLDSLAEIRRACTTITGCPDSLVYPFSNTSPCMLSAGNKLETASLLKGYILLSAGEITIDSSSKFEDILVVANKIRVREGFRGSAQLLATDTLIIEKGVTLEYPSGVYLYPGNRKRYALINPGSSVEGYVVIDGQGEDEVKYPNYRQPQEAWVSGLLYVEGICEFSGNVTGRTVLGEAVHYTPEGYYDNTIADAVVRESNTLALPVWFKAVGAKRKKEVKWLR